jgi:hypothetical protein
MNAKEAEARSSGRKIHELSEVRSGRLVAKFPERSLLEWMEWFKRQERGD